MSSGNQADNNMRQRLKAELHEYAIISLYLWVCFSAMLLFESAVLSDDGVPTLPMGIAVIKALVLGKFILIGKAVGIGARVQPKRLLHRIIWKSLAFLLLLIVFTGIEDLIVGLVHGHSISQIVTELVTHPMLQKIASSVLMLLVLIPMITFEEIDRDLGEGTLSRMLFGGSEPE